MLLRPRLDLVEEVDQVDDRNRAREQVLFEPLAQVGAVALPRDAMATEELAHAVES